MERSFTEPEAAAIDAVQTMALATRSSNGFLVLALRLRGRARKNTQDPLAGFRAVFYRRIHPLDPVTLRLIANKLDSRYYFRDPLTQQIAKSSHRAWAARLWDRADARTIRAFLAQPVPRSMGLRDRLYASLPLDPEAFAVVALDRTHGARRYPPRSVETLLALMRVFEPCLQRLAEHHGVFADRERLSPREVEVYRLLRDGYADKEIAQAIGLSLYTVRDLVREVLRKLQMSGRRELMRSSLLPKSRGPAPTELTRRAVPTTAGAGRAPRRVTPRSHAS